MALGETTYGRAELTGVLSGNGLRPVAITGINYTPRGWARLPSSWLST